MANEIAVSFALSASKGGATISLAKSKSLDMVGTDMGQMTQQIGTSAEVIAFGDIAMPTAYLAITNLDATNFVELALDSGMVNKFAKLLPGAFCLFPPCTSAIYAKADTAAVTVQVGAMEQ